MSNREQAAVNDLRDPVLHVIVRANSPEPFKVDIAGLHVTVLKRQDDDSYEKAMDMGASQVLVGAGIFNLSTDESGGYDNVSQGSSVLVRLAKDPKSYLFIGSWGIFRFYPLAPLTSLISTVDNATVASAWTVDMDGNYYLFVEGAVFLLKLTKQSRAVLRRHKYDPILAYYRDEFPESALLRIEAELVLAAP
jgi:hypothetical protein